MESDSFQDQQMAPDLSNVPGVKAYLLSFQGDPVMEARNGFVIFLSVVEMKDVHAICDTIVAKAGASKINVKALYTGVTRLVKEYTKRKRNGLHKESSQKMLKDLLDAVFVVPCLSSSSSSGVPRHDTPDQDMPHPPQLPGTLRGECGKCVTRREDTAHIIKSVKEKVKSTKKDLRDMKKRLNVKYINQFRKRKSEQISSRDKAIEDMKEAMATLRRQKVALSKRVAQLEEKNKRLRRQVKALARRTQQDMDTRSLQRKVLSMEADLEVMEDQAGDSSGHSGIDSKIDGKSYNVPIRKAVYNCLLANVPVESIGHVLNYTVSTLAGKRLKNVPTPSTCAQMMRELGVLSDMQSAGAVLQSSSCCLALDATTLDGRHINEIHINTPDAVFTLNTRQLPGGRAADYVHHILDTLDYLSTLHAEFSKLDNSTVLSSMKGKILSTLTDRAAANHATVALLDEHLGRSLLELNCQVHPLDGLANAARTTLKLLDHESNQRSRSFGSDCQAANVLHLISKLRYKEQGDPSRFKAHLRSNGLPCGTFVRYVGNRLHVLFHLAGKVHHHRSLLLDYADGLCSNNQMSLALKTDLRQPSICLHLQALGLLGKVVTGPWMALFYTPLTERRHFELSEYLRCAVHRLEVLEDQADQVVTCETDIFGRPLVVDDTLLSLRVCDNLVDLSVILSKLIEAFLKVLKRQLVRYIYGDLCNPSQDILDKACAAPVHNIWAERNLGMFDAQARRAANACIQFLDAKCKAAFNKTLSWLDDADSEHQHNLITFAAQTAVKVRRKEDQRQGDLNKEIFDRMKARLQVKDMSKRK